MAKSVYDRAKFTCSKEEDRNEEYRNITIILRNNGYHNRTLSKTRENLLRTNNNEQLEKVHTIVIPYVRGFRQRNLGELAMSSKYDYELRTTKHYKGLTTVYIGFSASVHAHV